MCHPCTRTRDGASDEPTSVPLRPGPLSNKTRSHRPATQRISVSIVQQRKPNCTLRREALDGHKKCFENKGALKTNTSSSTDFFYSVAAQHSTAQHGLQISELSRKNTSVLSSTRLSCPTVLSKKGSPSQRALGDSSESLFSGVEA